MKYNFGNFEIAFIESKIKTMERQMDITSSKKTQALEACDKVINGVEDGTMTVEAALLLCKKIARLVNDQDELQWLNYELGGYPRSNDGRILSEAWCTAEKHGRSYLWKDRDNTYKKLIFVELCNELEMSIESKKKAINNYTTQGFSVSGNNSLITTERMTLRVAQGTKDLIESIKESERRLSILKSQYYDYAVRWKIELEFGKAAQTIFTEYQIRVDKYFSAMPITTLNKLNAIEDLMEDGNPERYTQILTSCRRLWSETAKVLFSEVLPGYSQKTYKTKAGVEIDVSGDHDNNKLSAVIETLQSKAAKNTLVGSETIYLVDWLEQINSRQSTGVHAEVTREQAMQCIIHTYICLGDILSLKASISK